MEASGIHGENFITRLDIIIKKREDMRTDRCGYTSEDEYHAEGSIKEHKYKRVYRERERERERMWNMKCVSIPVITGVTRIVQKF
jgi:hypothetical protein